MRSKKAVVQIVKNVVIWMVSLVMLVPIALILINSVKTPMEANSMSMSIPTSFHFENYITVIEKGKLFQSFLNSMFYAVTSIGLSVVFCSMAAFVLARRKDRLSRFLYFFIILGIAMPVNHVALMKVMQVTHFINTRIGLSLLFTALQIPFSVFLIYGFIGTVPRELDEAAILDGCNSITLFFKIIMPLLKPVLITVAVLNFVGAWNEFILPLYYLNTTSKWPMNLAVYSFFGRFHTEWNLVCADIVLTSLSVIILYLIGQKYIISGLTEGSVKG